MSKTAGTAATVAAEKKRRVNAVIGLGAFLVLSGIVGTPTAARAELESVSLGAGAAVPLGSAYLTYGRYPTFTGDAIVHLESMSPSLRLVATAEMSEATVNNTTTQNIKLIDYSVYAGFRYQTPMEGPGIRPYAQLQVGAVYAVLGLSGVSTSIQDTGIEFGGRFESGFEAWLNSRFAVDFGFPLEYLAVQNSLFLWDAVISLRLKL